MALQHDIQHIGDSQKPQWWGAKQGLFINALANQYGTVTIDAAFRNVVNTNRTFSYEILNNGYGIFHNFPEIYTGSNATGFYFINHISVSFSLFEHFISFPNPRRSGASQFIQKNLLHTIFNFRGTSFPLNNSMFDNINNGNINYAKESTSIFPNLISTDDLYLLSDTFYLNFARLPPLLTPPTQSLTGTINCVRIYERSLSAKEGRDNYHAFTATNRSQLFLEYQFDNLANYYTFGGGLWIKNTGTSGNNLNNGTGYDMQLFGYVGNVPILQSIY